MKWGVAWSAVAESDLRHVPWQLAARVDAELMAFASGHLPTGRLERMSRNDPHRLRLRLPGASALLWIDARGRTIYVARVLRDTPPES